jgi:hypothetical protein
MLRPYAGIAVEHAEADADDLGVVRASAPELRPTDGAELLGEASVTGTPRPDEDLAAQDPKRARCDPGLRRGGRASAPLAARAMAVARAQKGRRHLKANAAAETAAGKREVDHAVSVSEPPLRAARLAVGLGIFRQRCGVEALMADHSIVVWSDYI